MKEKGMPTGEMEQKALPSAEMKQAEMPTPSRKKKEMPAKGNAENTVIIGGRMIEIKPTKLKYQRNHTAAFYRILTLYPLPEILAFEKGAFGDDRDGDKALMDFLIAATDNEEIILENYDEMDTETIERILSIFRRINHIDEKEAALKNMEADRKVV